MNLNKLSSPHVDGTNLEDINNRYVLFLFEGLANADELMLTEKKLSQGGFLKVGEVSMPSTERTIAATQFKTLLQEAIFIVKEQNAFLFFSNFKPFEREIHLPAMQFLANSGVDFQIYDFPSLNKDNFKILIETYERRKRSGRRESDSSARVEHATNNLNSEFNKLKTKRKKLQNVYWDTNNQKVLKELIRIKNDLPDYTDTYIAQLLTQKNILTRRGKQHTQKSVSRLKHRLQELNERFKYTVIDLTSMDNAMDIQASPTSEAIREGSGRSIEYRNNLNITKKKLLSHKLKKNEIPVKKSIESKEGKLKKEFSIQLISEENNTPQVAPYYYYNQIIIAFGQEWREDLEIAISISSLMTGEEKFALKRTGSFPKELILSLKDKDCLLLPGVHFLEVKVDGFAPIKKMISIMPFLNPSANQRKLKWAEKLKMISKNK